MEKSKTELPVIAFNLSGIGIVLWKIYKEYKKEKNKAKLRNRLAGLLGAITPDLLEGIRLILMGDGQKAWLEGDSRKFHLDFKIDPLINTKNDQEKDLKRRGLLQTVA